jgi:hypothetical protein
LKREVVTKEAFEKGELMQEITRTKKQLSFVSRKLQNVNPHPDLKAKEKVETIGIQKRMLEEENAELRSRLDELTNKM